MNLLENFYALFTTLSVVSGGSKCEAFLFTAIGTHRPCLIVCSAEPPTAKLEARTCYFAGGNAIYGICMPSQPGQQVLQLAVT